MKKKGVIIVAIIIILAIVLGFWISGIIPKQIAKISATNYLKKELSKKASRICRHRMGFRL